MNRTAIAVAYGTTASAAGIALTATSGWLIVRASEQPIMLTLLTAIVAVRAFGMARPFFRYLERLTSHDVALASLAQRRTSAYRTLIPLTPARLGARSHSAVLTGIVDDLTDVAEAPARAQVPALSSAFAALLAAGLAAVFLPVAGLIMLAYAGLIAAIAYWALRGERSAQPATAVAREKVRAVTDLAAWQAGDIAAIGAGPAVVAQLETAQQELQSALRRQAWSRSLLVAGLVLASALGTMVMAVAVIRFGLPTDAVNAPIAALLVLLPVATAEALSGLPDAIRSYVRAVDAGQRTAELLDQSPAVQGNGQALVPGDVDAPHTELRDVSASWASEVSLEVANLDLRPGAHVGVRGPNGSGKSTLLAVLARHLDPTAGSHQINGADANELSIAGVRALIASTGDEPHIFNASVAQNLLIAAPEASETQLVQALEAAGLGPWLSNLNNGLLTRLGLGAHTPSAGERARLAIARAVVSNRPILLLDEPTAHLDLDTAAAVMSSVRSVWAGKSLVLVTHRHDELSDFGDIVNLGVAPRPSSQRSFDAIRSTTVGPAR